MSTDDIGRIMDLLRENGERLASLETTVKTLDIKIDKYNGLKDKVLTLENDKARCDEALVRIETNCKNVQAAKANKLKPWVQLAFTVMGGIILILAGIVINIALKR